MIMRKNRGSGGGPAGQHPYSSERRPVERPSSSRPGTELFAVQTNFAVQISRFVFHTSHKAEMYRKAAGGVAGGSAGSRQSRVPHWPPAGPLDH